jgi:hypothetical protein
LKDARCALVDAARNVATLEISTADVNNLSRLACKPVCEIIDRYPAIELSNIIIVILESRKMPIILRFAENHFALRRKMILGRSRCHVAITPAGVIQRREIRNFCMRKWHLRTRRWRLWLTLSATVLASKLQKIKQGASFNASVNQIMPGD